MAKYIPGHVCFTIFADGPCALFSRIYIGSSVY